MICNSHCFIIKPKCNFHLVPFWKIQTKIIQRNMYFRSYCIMIIVYNYWSMIAFVDIMYYRTESNKYSLRSNLGHNLSEHNPVCTQLQLEFYIQIISPSKHHLKHIMSIFESTYRSHLWWILNFSQEDQSFESIEMSTFQ